MKSVEEIAAEIVMRGGGYVDDPDDPGGATNMGVTIGTLRRLGYDLDGDGRITTADLRRLSRAQATDIFIEHYYKRPRIDALPERLRASAFDMYVNSGANAVKILQRLLVAMRIPVAIDGIIGPQTVAAAARAVGIDVAFAPVTGSGPTLAQGGGFSKIIHDRVRHTPCP